MEKTLIFGHRKPDTDSVTSAIVLSYLKNKLGFNTEPRILGDISRETKFVLDYFGFKEPKYLNDVRLQIKDVEYNKNLFLHEKDCVLDGFSQMKKTKVGIIPIVDNKGKYLGSVSMKDTLGDLIDGDLGNLNTSYDNLIKSLKGRVILRFDEEIKGKIYVPSLNSESFKDQVKINRNSVLVLGDRYNLIEYAIENQAGTIILTNEVEIKEEHLELAEKNKVNIIQTAYDGIFTANLAVLSNYLKDKIISDDIVINENEALYDVMELANKKKYTNYPVLSNNGKCLGVFRANITNNKHPKKVILVDHNEVEQSVIGLDEAEIIEIVDHHKIGNIGTTMPINFRNMPVGCTETILYLMYKEHNIDIPKNIAGLMMSGIISDTLLLTSPTTTDIDKTILAELEKITGLNKEKYGMEMFKAGSSIEGKSLSEIIYGDFKNFVIDNQKLGIGQISTMSTDDIMNKKDDFVKELNEIANNENYKAVVLFVTDILKNGSYILFNDNSKEIMENSFGVEDIVEGYFFEGIVSRKKQMVPKIMNYMDNK